MLLHQQFVRMAKKHAAKMAIIDKSTGKNVNYSTALIGRLILSSKFEKYDKGFIGIMIPTSAGCALATVGALMSGQDTCDDQLFNRCRIKCKICSEEMQIQNNNYFKGPA